MAKLSYLSLFYLCVHSILSTTNHDIDDECPRHRKPWHLISDEERMQFVLGFQQLRNNGVLSAFCDTHHLEGIAFENIHKTSEFLFWHSYFVWEVESEFRNLGDEYSCFSMPYWDITHDSMYLEDPNTEYMPIFDSFIGSDGNIDNNHCVEDELWNTDHYNTEFLCSDSEISPNCCLKRQRNYNINKMGNKTEITNAMRLHKFRDFQDAISLIHGKVHKFFAQTNESHMYANNAAEDPIFVLLHSFIDYIRFMRSDCWQYDQLSLDELDDWIPFAFDRYVVEEEDELDFKPTLDTAMQFAFICDNERAFCSSNDVTPRVIFDAGSWGVSYELGTFWNDNDELYAFCSENLNDSWFYNQDVATKERVINHAMNGFSGVLFKEIVYCILGVTIAVLFMFVAIRQYAALYMKDNHEIWSKLTDKQYEPALYGTV